MSNLRLLICKSFDEFLNRLFVFVNFNIHQAHVDSQLAQAWLGIETLGDQSRYDFSACPENAAKQSLRAVQPAYYKRIARFLKHSGINSQPVLLQ